VGATSVILYYAFNIRKFRTPWHVFCNTACHRCLHEGEELFNGQYHTNTWKYNLDERV
jgi:hypothetical protein